MMKPIIIICKANDEIEAEMKVKNYLSGSSGDLWTRYNVLSTEKVDRDVLWNDLTARGYFTQYNSIKQDLMFALNTCDDNQGTIAAEQYINMVYQIFDKETIIFNIETDDFSVPGDFNGWFRINIKFW